MTHHAPSEMSDAELTALMERLADNVGFTITGVGFTTGDLLREAARRLSCREANVTREELMEWFEENGTSDHTDLDVDNLFADFRLTRRGGK